MVIPINFSNRKTATALRATADMSGQQMVAALGLDNARYVLLLHGGALGMAADNLAEVYDLFLNGIAPIIVDEEITVVDGGTQAGVAQMIGESCAALNPSAPLIGVCPLAKAFWPGGPIGPDRHALEPNHTHFVLTPGIEWGDETPFMFALAAALGEHFPSLALLINGGEISKREVLANLRQEREILIVNGTGRLADGVAALREGSIAPIDDEIVEIARNDKLTVFNIIEGPTRLASLIRRKLIGPH